MEFTTRSKRERVGKKCLVYLILSSFMRSCHSINALSMFPNTET